MSLAKPPNPSMHHRALGFAASLSLLIACSGAASVAPDDDARARIDAPSIEDRSPVEAAATDHAPTDAPPVDAAADDTQAADVARDDAGADAATDAAMDARAAPSDTAADAPGDVAADGRGADVPAGGPTHPFGAHRTAYTAGAIRPSGAQSALDDATAAFYDQWRARYLHRGCAPDRAYVATMGDTAGATVSEAHGYGMLITVYMAGHDPSAQSTFDALVRFYTDHPSRYTRGLMAWAQDAACRDIQGSDSATDGDLDVAYALLLADRQWGSRGALDYAALARTAIDAILRGDVHPTGATLLTGDAAMTTADRDGTRLSDFMPDHLRAFGRVVSAARWNAVMDREYAVVATLQRERTTTTSGLTAGLLPDFAVGMNAGRTAPAPPRWLEAPTDGDYAWNACRTPWRLAMDWLLHGDARARAAVETMNTWIRHATGDRPAQIQSGYTLTGTRLSGASGGEMAFVAPFAVAATVDARHHAWLDALWRAITAPPLASQAYFGNSIRMLSMIAVSGNAWAP